ncbi:unnamed protein product [Nyctereutes procyonoides]|uniref:(raccoon dog) hypothetical protein n=1 Tax=Nyctereutes procyonoides TaxID=34880 RepID=A0A811YUQ3_NYCPR|nr:unnamed protein product [Nyctereutes procyonoides]
MCRSCPKMRGESHLEDGDHLTNCRLAGPQAHWTSYFFHRLTLKHD